MLSHHISDVDPPWWSLDPTYFAVTRENDTLLAVVRREIEICLLGNNFNLLFSYTKLCLLGIQRVHWVEERGEHQSNI
jgi:hypothetical protein